MSTLINTSRGLAPSDKPGGDKGSKRTHEAVGLDSLSGSSASSDKPGGDKGRKRAHVAAGLDSSSGGGVGDGEGNDKRRKPGVTKAPRGLDNVHPPGDQAIDQESQTRPTDGEDVDEQPPTGPSWRQ